MELLQCLVRSAIAEGPNEKLRVKNVFPGRPHRAASRLVGRGDRDSQHGLGSADQRPLEHDHIQGSLNGLSGGRGAERLLCRLKF